MGWKLKVKIKDHKDNFRINLLHWNWCLSFLQKPSLFYSFSGQWKALLWKLYLEHIPVQEVKKSVLNHQKFNVPIGSQYVSTIWGNDDDDDELRFWHVNGYGHFGHTGSPLDLKYLSQFFSQNPLCKSEQGQFMNYVQLIFSNLLSPNRKCCQFAGDTGELQRRPWAHMVKCF